MKKFLLLSFTCMSVLNYGMDKSDDSGSPHDSGSSYSYLGQDWEAYRGLPQEEPLLMELLAVPEPPPANITPEYSQAHANIHDEQIEGTQQQPQAGFGQFLLASDLTQCTGPQKYLELLQGFSQKDNKYVCNFCPNTFPSEKGAAAHIISHSDQRHFQCPDCLLKFGKIKELVKHALDEHKQDRLFQCALPNCTKKYKDLKTLTQHIKNSHLKIRHVCQECKQLFMRKVTLLEHRQSKHSQAEPVQQSQAPQPVDLQAAQSSTTTQEPQEQIEGTDHSVRPTDGAQGQEYSDQGQHDPFVSTEQHEPMQLPDPQSSPAKDPVSDLTQFNDPSKYLASLQGFSKKDNKYVCNFCPKTFPSEKGAVFHVKQKHSDKSRFQCPDCPLKFGKTKELESHALAKHSERKPFQCALPNCTKKYKDLMNLTQHIKDSHLKIRHVCQECKQLFMRKVTLLEHRQSQHPQSEPVQQSQAPQPVDPQPAQSSTTTQEPLQQTDKTDHATSLIDGTNSQEPLDQEQHNRQEAAASLSSRHSSPKRLLVTANLYTHTLEQRLEQPMAKKQKESAMTLEEQQDAHKEHDSQVQEAPVAGPLIIRIKTYTNVSEYLESLRDCKQTADGQDEYSCKFCPEKFKNCIEAAGHICRHRKFTCRHCGSEMEGSEALIDHARTNHGESRPFTCALLECGAAAQTFYDLKHHVREKHASSTGPLPDFHSITCAAAAHVASHMHH